MRAFFPGSTLPKKAVIKFSEIESNQTHIAVQVTDTHKLGFKAGFVKKYEQALQDLANSISFRFK